jgi:hypothetical protein
VDDKKLDQQIDLLDSVPLDLSSPVRATAHVPFIRHGDDNKPATAIGPIPSTTAPGFPLVVAQPAVIPDVLDMGPGPSSYTVVRWTAPSRGCWDVVGQFFGTGLTTGDVNVLRNGTPVFDSLLNGSQIAPFSLVIDVNRGDTVDFAAGPGPDGNNDFDSTGFNVTITPEL